MKTVNLLLLVAMSLPFSAPAQTKKADPGKFRINLPDYWGKSSKVMSVLIDQLPLICPELAGKDVCGDNCRPKYKVEFYLTAPYVTGYYTQKQNPPVPTKVINITKQAAYLQSLDYATSISSENTWNVTGYYNFQCYLLLMDDADSILTKLILVDTDESFADTHIVNLNRGNTTTFSEQNISSYIDNNKNLLVPAVKTLFEIAENRILALKN